MVSFTRYIPKGCFYHLLDQSNRILSWESSFNEKFDRCNLIVVFISIDINLISKGVEYENFLNKFWCVSTDYAITRFYTNSKCKLNINVPFKISNAVGLCDPSCNNVLRHINTMVLRVQRFLILSFQFITFILLNVKIHEMDNLVLLSYQQYVLVMITYTLTYFAAITTNNTTGNLNEDTLYNNKFNAKQEFVIRRVIEIVTSFMS